MAKHFLQNIRDWFPPGLLRFILNIWPPFFFLGIRVAYIAPDFKEVKVKLKLHWYNKNYVGVHFGGSLYSITDAFYMLILIKNLGENYIVWDKAAQIDFKKPGLGTVYAHFIMSQEEIDFIRQQADTNDRYIFDKPVDVVNENNEVICSAIRTLYVKRKPQNDNPTSQS
jgi:hypothetical protein